VVSSSHIHGGDLLPFWKLNYSASADELTQEKGQIGRRVDSRKGTNPQTAINHLREYAKFTERHTQALSQRPFAMDVDSRVCKHGFQPVPPCDGDVQLLGERDGGGGPGPGADTRSDFSSS